MLPPAANGTMIRTGRDGYSSAMAFDIRLVNTRALEAIAHLSPRKTERSLINLISLQAALR
jgi:hypothetical protein